MNKVKNLMDDVYAIVEFVQLRAAVVPMQDGIAVKTNYHRVIRELLYLYKEERRVILDTRCLWEKQPYLYTLYIYTTPGEALVS